MIDGYEKRNRQLAFELQNTHACEKRSKKKVKARFFLTVALKCYPRCWMNSSEKEETTS